MKISYIVPVHKTEKTLEKCLDSLLDQDYKDAEIIVVLDGKSKVAEKICAKKKVKVIEQKNAGAPAARNRGAKEATGDILWFFDSDSYLRPGMARLFVEEFEKQPDMAFGYGNYIVKGANVPLEARDFDPYVLRSQNYISTMSPIRKADFMGWDENCKSLQDWEMFLRMSNAGKKGFFLHRNVFETEPPQKDGISLDSHNNWLDRIDYIQKKNGIKASDTAVCSLGAPQHALNTAKILKADYHAYPSHKPHRWKKIILLGFYTNGGERGIAAHFGVFKNAPKNCKKIIYWIGTDIVYMYKMMNAEMLFGFNGNPGFAKTLEEDGYQHVCETPNTQKELAVLGIKAKVIPLPPKEIYDITPLPKKFSVGVYVNPTQNVYYEKEMFEIARSMPDINFRFYGGAEMDSGNKAENVEWMGYVKDMDKFIDETACVLRMTAHDGLPIAPVEFVLKGRQAIISLGDGSLHADLPHMIQIPRIVWDKRKDKLVKAIRFAKKRFDKGYINREGHDYYAKLMDHNKFNTSINAL